MTEPIPTRAMIDTGVFLRWLGERDDHDAESCRVVVDAIIKRGTVLIAAPTVAEVLRWGSKTPIPTKRGLEVVAFDSRAAHELAKHFPMNVIRDLARVPGTSSGHLKYDSMIVASAIRHRAQVHIAIDADHPRLCATAGMKCVTPSAMRDRQMSLPEIE